MKVVKHLRREQEKQHSVRYEVVDTNVEAHQGRELLYIKKADLEHLMDGSTRFPDELEVTIEVASS